jgi:Putative zinc-finger
MAERSSDFRDTLVELIEASPEPMDHPSSDRWLAYHRGELSAEEEERLQEHLVRCRDCFDLATAAAAFAAPDGEPGAGQDTETAALWRLLRPQLGPSAGNVRAISAGPRERPPWKFRLPSSLAALFLVALVGLTAWNLQLQSARQAPQANVPIFDFTAVERDTAQRELTVPAGPGMLVLHPEGDLPVYRLVIRDAATGEEILSNELRLNPELALTLYLPELRPGHYRLELTDLTGNVETHLLRVTEAVKRPGR